MRVKQLWTVIPLPSKLKFAYSRVTLNIPTTVFFILALVQCLLQIALHIWLYTQHEYASGDLAALVLNSTIVTMPLAVQIDNDLLLCKDIPTLVGGPDKCTKAQFSTVTPKRSLSATPQFDASGKLANMTIVDSDTHHVSVVSKQCVDVLPWVFQSLRATNREDMTFFVYHAWLFVISLTAILNESMPDLIAAFAMEVLCVIGSAARVMATSYFQRDFKRMVVNGSCSGIDLLGPSYFQSRNTAEIVIGALNFVALVAFTGLSWHLFKIYGQRSFERVHKRPEMNRLYIVILTMCTCIQLTTFYMVAAIGLFIDQLVFGPLRDLALYKPVYLIADIALLVLVVPWVILGWTSGRMESRPRTLMFLAFTIMFMATCAAMFVSPVYRLLIMTWRYFAMTSILPIVLMFVVLLLALYSWFHLDLGLAEYLNAEEPHPADKVRWSLAVTSDPEKGGSPSSGVGGTKPQVTWVRLPSPNISKPPTATQKSPRSPPAYSASTEGSKGGFMTTGNIVSKFLSKPRSVSLDPDPYLPPPPGLMPVPQGLPVISVLPASKAGSRRADFAPILPPGLPFLLNAAAADCVRQRTADDGVISKGTVDAPPGIKQPSHIPSGVKPSQRNRL